MTASVAWPRSVGHGDGVSFAMLERAVAALNDTTLIALPSAGGAVANNKTGRLLRTARSAIANATSRLTSHRSADAQPLSITRSTGPLEPISASAFIKGRDAAKIINAAISSRNNNIHQGVRAELSRSVTMSSNKRIGGNTMRFGMGGVRRNNHQIAGSAISAPRAHG